MANLRDIKRRIKSVKNTAQITKAMQLVAASKMKRAQNSALESRPYTQLMAEILIAIEERAAESDQKGISHPYLEGREVQNRGILLITPDKGLCGPLTANLFRLVAQIPHGEASYVSIGRKGSQFLSRTQRSVLAEFSLSDRARFSEIRPPVELLLEAYAKREIDTIEVLYTRFKNTLQQEAMRKPVVPIVNLADMVREVFGDEDYTAEAPLGDDRREMLFEPDPQSLLNNLMDLAVRRSIYQSALEAKASEHSARMVAMKTATDNANSLVEDLTLQYNKARQAAITQEILEIAAATASSQES